MQSTALIRPLRGAFMALLCRLGIVAGLTGLVFTPVPSLHAAEEEKVQFDVPAGDAGKALKTFARQAQREIMFPLKPLGGVKTNAVQGELTVKDGLNRLLAGTDLSAYVDEKTGGLVVQRQDDPNVNRAIAESGRPGRNSDLVENEQGEKVIKLDTFEVLGKKSLNMDIPRTRNDAQPYVVFDHTTIEDSGATSLGDFLKQRLTMNTQDATARQGNNVFGNASEVNLRGLGTNQTLILVDGHRVANITRSSDPQQPDLNGIPLSAIERIEVLPTTASGIYGGGATGGVVNIVLRRDYSGLEVKFTYGNTFQSDTPSKRVDVGAGWNLEGGKTTILFAGSWSEDSPLFVGDRASFIERTRSSMLASLGGNYDALTVVSSGTPPLSTTPNIRSSTGVTLTLKPAFGGASLGSPITFVPFGFQGVAQDGVTGLIQNAGKFNLELADTNQSGLSLGSGRRYPLLSATSTYALNLTARRRFSERFEAFVDLNHSENRSGFNSALFSAPYTVAANAPNNPFNQALRVTAPLDGSATFGVFLGRERGVVGGVAKLGREWMAELDYSYERSSYEVKRPRSLRTATFTNDVSTGVFDLLRDPAIAPFNLTSYIVEGKASYTPKTSSVAYDGVLRLAGPAWTLPGGPLTVSLLAERRVSVLEPYVSLAYNAATDVTTTSLAPERRQSVNSAYVEAQVPVFSQAREGAWAKELSLQLAVRGDDYSTVGGANNMTTLAYNKVRSVDPTVGLRYVPVKDVMLRASYGTGFLPPNVAQLVPFAPRTSTVADPKRNDESVTYNLITGGNPDLKPEESESWSAGVVLTPSVLPGLRLSLDYTNIVKRDNITTLTADQTLFYEDLIPERVQRAAPAPGQTVGVVQSIDLRRINIAQADVEAYDVQLDYTRDLGPRRTLAVYAVATWQTHYRTQVLASEPRIENVGFSAASPLKFKANFGATLKWHGWKLGWNSQYFDSYQVLDLLPSSPAIYQTIIQLQGNGGKIPSQFYHDILVSYQLRSNGAQPMARYFRALEITMGVQNAFNTAPPRDQRSSVYFYSPFADPRLRRYTLSLKSSF